jgi:tricorn protease
MFFTQESFDRFKLNKEDAALAKETEENKAKADTTKKKEVKKDSVLIDWDGLILSANQNSPFILLL